MVLRPSKGSEFIESFSNDNSVYVLFDSKTRPSGKLPFDCKTIDVANNQEVLNRIQSTSSSKDKTYKKTISQQIITYIKMCLDVNRFPDTS